MPPGSGPHLLAQVRKRRQRRRLLRAARTRVTPARDEVTSILERGQAVGVFHTHVPPAALSAALEAVALSLVESVNAGVWQDDGTATATATLIAAGVSAKHAEAEVHGLAALLDHSAETEETH